LEIAGIHSGINGDEQGLALDGTAVRQAAECRYKLDNVVVDFIHFNLLSIPHRNDILTDAQTCMYFSFLTTEMHSTEMPSVVII
jgi:hypothetical protein